MKKKTLVLIFLLLSLTRVIAQVDRTYGVTSTNYISMATDGEELFAGAQNGKIYQLSHDWTNWTSYGPKYISIRSFLVNDLNMYAGTSKGVYFSTNYGYSWTAINKGMENIQVTSLALRGTNLFAGTACCGVYVSTDNGSTWAASNTGLTDLYIWSMASSGPNLIAGNNSGVFLSTDNGHSWNKSNTGLENQGVLSLSAIGTNLFAGTLNGPYVSTDNGASWSAANTGLKNIHVNSFFQIGTKLFSAVNGKGVYVSSNNGVSWSASNTGIENKSVYGLSSVGLNLVAGTSDGVYRSTDNGVSWINCGFQGGFALTSLGRYIYVATNGDGIYRADNYPTWYEVYSANSTREISALVCFNKMIFAGYFDEYYNVTKKGGVLLSTDNGKTWAEVNSGLPNEYVYALAVSGGNLFAGTYKGVYVSTNNGTSWSALNNGIGTHSVYCFAVNGSSIYAGSYGNIYLSTNNGSSWTVVGSGLTGLKVNALALTGTNILAGTEKKEIYLLTNTGTSWIASNSGMSDSTIYALAVNGDNVYAGSYDKVYVSTNYGASWSMTPAGFKARSFALRQTDLYAGGYDYISRLSLSQQGLYNLLLSPNGGEYLTGGSKYVIRWFSDNSVPLVIEYSTNNGNTWTTIDNLVSNLWFYSWTVPNTVSSQCKIRISTGSNYSDVSDNVFSIGVVPTLSLVTPNLSDNYLGNTPLTIKWNSVGISNIKIEFSTDNGKSWATINSSVTASAGSYNWLIPNTPSRNCKVRISDAGGSGISDESDQTFKITGLNIVSPKGGENWIPGTLQNITWICEGLSSVKIYYSTNNGLNWSSLVSSTLASTGSYSWTVPDIPSKTCKIKITNDGTLPVSDISDSCFTIMIAVPATPSMLTPLNNSINQPTSLTLAWTYVPIASSYKLLVSTDQTFNSQIVNDSTIISTSRTITGLNYNTRYYWCIGAKNSSGSSPWSGIFNFKTAPRPLAAPANLSAAASKPGIVNLSWKDNSDNEIGFAVLRKEGDTTSINNYQQLKMLGANVTSYSDLTVKSGTKYSYQVYALSSDSVYSYSNQTTVTTATSVELSEMKPAQYQLFQNFPNPFNPRTSIYYSLPENSHVLIKVYDALGNDIEKLVDQEMPAGTHKIEFNGSRLNSGIYFYTIQASNYRETKKLLLMK